MSKGESYIIYGDFYLECIETFDLAYEQLTKAGPSSAEFDMFRSACLQEFDTIMEHTGKILRKMLLQYVHSRAVLKGLAYKDIYRKAGQYGLISVEQIEQWLIFHNNRCFNNCEAGERFHAETLPLFSKIHSEAHQILKLIETHNKKVQGEACD